MKILTHIPLPGAARRFREDQNGAVLVEFAVAISLTLVIFVILLDFGRMGFNYVAAEKAVQTAARIAAVRPPACAGLPQRHLRAAVLPDSTPPRFGTFCRMGTNVCVDPGDFTCTATAGDPTSDEIWAYIRPRLPNDATRANVLLRYDHDPDLGFLGGPYVPMVTVEVQNLQFRFLTPIGRLLTLVTGNAPDPNDPAAIAFPGFSASVPAEDLAQGTAG